MTELKPCPFCGGVNITIVTMHYGVKIECFDCGANISRVKDNGEYRTLANARKRHEKKATEAWNRRINRWN